MLHQRRLISSTSSSSPSPLCCYSHSPQVEMEVPCSEDHEDEEFVVDDLLDFGELAETEEQEEAVTKKNDDEESDLKSSLFSPLSFDPSPISEIVPAHDATELEWVSRLMDDTLTEFPPCAAAIPPAKPPSQEITTCNNTQHAAEFKAGATKAKRSKRSRTHSPYSWYSFGSSDSSSSATSSSSSSSSFSYSSPLVMGKIPKKRGRKPKGETVQFEFVSVSERRCSHCGVSKTPQWRAGPAGAKTLCNACGVRYKSGRLLPEYRPACSPTFISHVHSNSHRKVMEMRRKKEAASF